MQLSNPEADVFVPGGGDFAEALARTTHLAIGAHQDDIEFMALHGVLACYNREDRWFTGVTVTDGAGSPRSGPYADYSDEEMRRVRVAEQRTAAMVGGYSCQIQLRVPSSVAKDAGSAALVGDLRRILEAASPEVVYLHNPADRHDTHVGCCLRAIAALRELPGERRPKRVYGCEIWRDLDWLADADKQLLPVGDRPNVAAALTAVFDSQITGGKRYDLAVQGRWVANATFLESHAVDEHDRLSYAMDLTPLVEDPAADVSAFAVALLRRTEAEIRARIGRLS
jgi:LmbE family N-acetylglucosaminyl deacetylase